MTYIPVGVLPALTVVGDIKLSTDWIVSGHRSTTLLVFTIELHLWVAPVPLPSTSLPHHFNPNKLGHETYKPILSGRNIMT